MSAPTQDFDMRAAPILLAALLAALLAVAAPVHAQAQARPYDRVPINELVTQTQKTSASTDTVDLVWWLPPAFWEVSLAHSEGVDDSMRKEIHELFEKYVVVAAVRGSIGNFGVKDFMTEAQLRAGIQLVATDGSIHRPIPEADVDSRLGVMIGALKPMFTSVLGELGKNLNFFAFPGEANGRPLADPLGNGTMTVKLADADYVFRLPLDSLLIPSQDPKTLDQFPGSYRFNPYTGGALQPMASE